MGVRNGCRDKIRFCCLPAEGAGKPTSPYPMLISSVPDVSMRILSGVVA
jgi:hypothetical protein